jgi:hypothetical protein
MSEIYKNSYFYILRNFAVGCLLSNLTPKFSHIIVRFAVKDYRKTMERLRKDYRKLRFSFLMTIRCLAYRQMSVLNKPRKIVQGGSNMTGTICV